MQTRYDLVAHLHRQREFSARTSGPGARTAGVLDHIRKELAEIEAKPADLTEWIDVVLLGPRRRLARRTQPRGHRPGHRRETGPERSQEVARLAHRRTRQGHRALQGRGCQSLRNPALPATGND
ncbi:MAG: DUF550 domain-containing protein [Rhodocyclaceae bacterium]|nr:DUF550 domain-containing protein [Rhodocyclaceae bacterium]